MINKRIILSMFVASLLIGCTTLDPYTREEKTSKATKGALIGAASGAVAGLLTGDDATERRQHVLIGAGVGALTGAAVGNYMDRQEMKLRQQLEGSGVSVTRNGDEIILNMPGNVTFETNSSELYSGFYEVLDSVAVVLDEFDKTVVEVSGHTDSTGSDSYNMSLSQKRAGSVAAYVRNRGVDDQRVVTLAYGEEKPVASNDSPSGRQQNRRVELRLVPLIA